MNEDVQRYEMVCPLLCPTNLNGLCDELTAGMMESCTGRFVLYADWSKQAIHSERIIDGYKQNEERLELEIEGLRNVIDRLEERIRNTEE